MYVPALRLPHLPQSINWKSPCSGANWLTHRHAEIWLSAGKAKNWNWIFWVTILVMSCPSYILVQILVQHVIQIKRTVSHFTHHTLPKQPHKGTILGGNNRNFSGKTAAASDPEKEYSCVILRNKMLAEMPNLHVNWEGQMSFLVDITNMIAYFIAFSIQTLLWKKKNTTLTSLLTRFCYDFFIPNFQNTVHFSTMWKSPF